MFKWFQVYQVETDVCWPVFCPQISDVSYQFWATTPEWESSTLRRMKENEVLQVANLPSNLWQDGLDERNPPKSVAMLVLLTWSWPESVENPSASVEQRLWGVKKNMHSSCKSVRDKNTTNIQMRYCRHLIVTNRRKHLFGDIFSIYLWKWNLASIYPMKQNVSLAIATGHVGL